MVMTILESRVTKENWAALEQAYAEAGKVEEMGLVQSFLVQNARDQELWRIMTVWASREALEAMRSKEETPRGVLIFRQAQAEPQLSIFNINQQIDPM